VRRIVGYVRRHHVGLVALTVALGGTSYAAVALPRNSVGGPQLKRDAITSSKVRDGSLLARDFKRGQLPAGQRGESGEAGPQGTRGEPGQPGAPGPAGTSVVARPHGEAAVTTASAPAEYPLVANTWAQGASETDFVLGEITVQRPSSNECAGGATPLTATLKAGAQTVAVVAIPSGGASSDTTTLPLPAATSPSRTSSPVGLFEPGVATSRSLTLTFADTCQTALHFTVTGVRLAVYGVS
jgi:hypothetical protein